MLLVYATTFIIIISPGPSGLTIISTSMIYGRSSGFLVAAGIICGAVTWGTLAAVGVSALLAVLPGAVVGIRIFGGIYLAFLAYGSVVRVIKKPELHAPAINKNKQLFYLKGYGVHMSNPEAMLGWIAIISIGMTENAPRFASFYIVAGCVAIAIVVYNSYAFLFSIGKISSLYQRVRVYFDVVFAILFALAAYKLLEIAV